MGWNRKLVVMETLVSIAVVMPSSCGIFVYRLVTSIDTRIVFSVTSVFSRKLMKFVVSLRYEVCCLAIGWSKLSTNDDIRWVGPPQPDMIGLPSGLALWIFVRVQNSGIRILGDPGAVSGGRESLNRREKNSGKEKSRTRIRAPGYKVLTDQFQTVGVILASDWCQKVFVFFFPITEQQD